MVGQAPLAQAEFLAVAANLITRKKAEVLSKCPGNLLVSVVVENELGGAGWHALSVSEGRGLPRTPLPTPIAPLCACHAVRATRPVQGVPIVPRIPKTWGAEQGIRIDAVAWTSQDAVVGVRS